MPQYIQRDRPIAVLDTLEALADVAGGVISKSMDTSLRRLALESEERMRAAQIRHDEYKTMLNIASNEKMIQEQRLDKLMEQHADIINMKALNEIGDQNAIVSKAGQKLMDDTVYSVGRSIEKTKRNAEAYQAASSIIGQKINAIRTQVGQEKELQRSDLIAYGTKWLRSKETSEIKDYDWEPDEVQSFLNDPGVIDIVTDILGKAPDEDNMRGFMNFMRQEGEKQLDRDIKLMNLRAAEMDIDYKKQQIETMKYETEAHKTAAIMNMAATYNNYIGFASQTLDQFVGEMAAGLNVGGVITKNYLDEGASGTTKKLDKISKKILSITKDENGNYLFKDKAQFKNMKNSTTFRRIDAALQSTLANGGTVESLKTLFNVASEEMAKSSLHGVYVSKLLASVGFNLTDQDFVADLQTMLDLDKQRDIAVTRGYEFMKTGDAIFLTENDLTSIMKPIDPIKEKDKINLLPYMKSIVHSSQDIGAIANDFGTRVRNNEYPETEEGFQEFYQDWWYPAGGFPSDPTKNLGQKGKSTDQLMFELAQDFLKRNDSMMFAESETELMDMFGNDVWGVDNQAGSVETLNAFKRYLNNLSLQRDPRKIFLEF